MYSMKRIGIPRGPNVLTKSMIWFSLTSFLMTVLILRGRPMLWASPMAFRTIAGVASVSPINWYVFTSKASNEIVARLSPASTNASKCLLSKRPLVVIAMSSSSEHARNWRTNSLKFLRSNGSPPVSRTLRRPCGSRACTTRTISSNRRISSFGRNS